MNTKPITDFITKPRLLGPAVFIAMGVYKTGKDYKKAKPERKNRTLAKDVAILAGSAAAFAVAAPLTKRFCHTQFVETCAKGLEKVKQSLRKKPFFQKPFFHRIAKISASLRQTQKITYESFKKTEHVLKESIAGTVNTFAGIVGAIYTNEVMHKYVLNKPPFTDGTQVSGGNGDPVKKHKEPHNHAQYTANRIFDTIVDLPAMRAFERSTAALAGFDVANTKGYHNKFKAAAYELLANTLIPTIFVSITSLGVSKTKWFVKYPALLAALSVGAIAGAKVADKYKDAIDEKIDGIDFKNIVV